jgi:hypothetical protein
MARVPELRLAEDAARALCFMRAVESAPAASAGGTLWSAEDAAWATREALHAEGASASAARFLASRAQRVAERVAERHGADAAAGALRSGGAHPAASRDGGARSAASRDGGVRSAASRDLRWWLLPLAVLLGCSADALSAGQGINILAPPLLALLVWNLVVYGLLVWHAVHRWATRHGRMLSSASAGASAGESLDPRSGAARSGAPSDAGLDTAWISGWSARWYARLVPAAHRTGRARADVLALRTRFLAGWAAVSRPLYQARWTAVLHGAAALFTLAALGSWYARGLVFEYRASWQSTFLSPPAVHHLLAVVLGPASAVSGIGLPTVDDLVRLRGPALMGATAAGASPAGENAARWIHLWALTLTAVVVLPRLLLAGFAAGRARRLARRLPVPLGDAYFQHLLRALGGAATPVQVLPYSYHLSPAARAGLQPALEARFGAVELALSEPLPLGAEDDLAPWLHTAGTGAAAMGTPKDAPKDLPKVTPASVHVALFALTATPEREAQGAFAKALNAAVGGGLQVWVDESGFRQRFTGAQGELRRAQRRQAWQAVLDDVGMAVHFCDLSIGAGAAADAQSAGPAQVPR